MESRHVRELRIVKTQGYQETSARKDKDEKHVDGEWMNGSEKERQREDQLHGPTSRTNQPNSYLLRLHVQKGSSEWHPTTEIG